MKSHEFNYIEHYKTDAQEFDYFEEKSGATLHDERRVHETIIHAIPNDFSSILDVGSGSAWIAKEYAKKDKNVISFDISSVNTKKAKKIVSDNNHTPVTGDSFFLPFKTASFDIVVSSEVIEHVVDPTAFITELFRVVKPGGKLIITTPYKEKLQYSLCIHCNKKTPLHAHIHSFDEHILKNLYKGEDIQNVEWQTFGNKLLIFLRTYVILKFFPYTLWRMKDKAANLFFNKPVHIIVTFNKK